MFRPFDPLRLFSIWRENWARWSDSVPAAHPDSSVTADGGVSRLMWHEIEIFASGCGFFRFSLTLIMMNSWWSAAAAASRTVLARGRTAGSGRYGGGGEVRDLHVAFMSKRLVSLWFAPFVRCCCHVAAVEVILSSFCSFLLDQFITTLIPSSRGQRFAWRSKTKVCMVSQVTQKRLD